MKVGVYYSNKDIRVEERPIPKIKNGEILMKTKACGICGTDLLEWYRIKRAPIILGHEATGEIIESKADNYKPGEKIFASHHIPCNRCHYCLNNNHTSCETLQKTNYDPGGFSEYIRLSKMNVDFGIYFLPNGISFESATLIEPLGCVIRAQRLARVWERETLLVIGCGISGLLHIILGKMKGLKTIAIDINEYRLNCASNFGADLVINGNKDVLKIIKKNASPPDCIILCCSSPKAIDTAFSLIDKGGIIVFFSVSPPNIKIPFPITRFWKEQITIITSYGAGPSDLQASLKIIERIDTKTMITNIFPLLEIQKAFSLVEKQGRSIKVVIKL